MKALYCVLYCTVLYCTVLYYLARDGSSKVVNTETNVGRVDESSGGGGDSMGVSSIGSRRVGSITKWSIALSGGIKSLGERVKTGAGAERDSSSTLAVVDKSIPSSTRDRNISSVYTGGALETNTIGQGETSIASIPSIQQSGISLSRDGCHEGGCYNQKFHDDDTALIFAG